MAYTARDICGKDILNVGENDEYKVYKVEGINGKYVGGVRQQEASIHDVTGLRNYVDDNPDFIMVGNTIRYNKNGYAAFVGEIEQNEFGDWVMKYYPDKTNIDEFGDYVDA
jgi:hypothetical protein